MLSSSTSTGPAAPPPRWLARLRSASRRHLTGAIGAIIVGTMIAMAVFAPQVSGFGPTQQSIRDRLQPPSITSGSGTHVLGTDSLGRDILSRVAHGARVSLWVSAAAGLLSCFLGVALGLISGYFGGVIDAIIMRLADIQLAIPSLILALAVIAVLGSSVANIILVLVITNWVIFARLVRAEVLSLKEREFVAAITALGAHTGRILLRHLVPNLAGSIVVVLTLRIGILILIEATLSYLGLGVQPPTPTWGSMIAEGQQLVYRAWWVSTFPGVALAVTVLGLNLLGDWLRDRLDPKTSS